MDLLAEYQTIMEEHRKEGSPPAGAPFDKRSYPRLKIQSNDLWINSIPEFVLEDMSVSGIAIRSNSPMEPGEMIKISLGSSFSAEAEVVGSRLLISPDEFTDGEFLIQCRYLENLQGMDLLVKTVHYHS